MYTYWKVGLNNIRRINWKYDKYRDIKKELPIPFLRESVIPKYIPAELIYRGIDDYIRASKNDVDQESDGLIDIDKVINHGFDKRTSFRNIKD